MAKAYIYLLANYNINVKTDDIEIYNNHFIRVSGNSLNNYYDLEDKTAEIEQLIKLYGLDKVKDAEIKDNILNSKGNYYKEILDDKTILKIPMKIEADDKLTLAINSIVI